MMRFLTSLILVLVAAAQEVSPPVAKVVPKRLEAHGDVRVDDYYWLRERDNPDVLAYLEAENAYLEAVMKHTEGLQEQLFQEIKGRIKKDDSTVPYAYDGYYYFTRVEADKEYKIYCRKKGSLDAREEILVDANELAEGYEYFSIRGVRVSSGRDKLVFGVDTVGRRFYELRFKNLTTGAMYADVISDVTPNVAWANDNKTLFYTKQDPETLRWNRIFRHELGTPVARDELVYEENDETFSSFVFKTRSRKYIIIGSAHTLSSEYRFVDADRPAGEFTVIEPRERDHEYGLTSTTSSISARTGMPRTSV